MHLDALCVSCRDEGLQGIEPGSDRLVHGEPRAKAEAVAAPDDLRHDRVGVDGLGRADERIDLALVVDALAERVRPERAELAGRGRRPDRSNLRREGGERAGDVPEDSRERGELQSFPFLNARNGLLTTSLRVALRSSQASERGILLRTVVPVGDQYVRVKRTPERIVPRRGR
jgi:hypothetical protein